MTREEIEQWANHFRIYYESKWPISAINSHIGLELCRLALIGEPIDRREREIAAALDEISAEGQACDAVIDGKRYAELKQAYLDMTAQWDDIDAKTK